MKREYKVFLTGILFLPVSLFFLEWGLIDILSVTGGPIELLIVVPVIVTFIYLLIFGVIVVAEIISRQRNILYKKIIKCTVCGALIKLEEEICTKCGAENIIRSEALEKLDNLERKIEIKRSENLRTAKSTKTRRTAKLQEMDDELLSDNARKVRMKKTQLIIGTSHEGKLEWIKTQYYDLGRTIQDIADDLDESMITVRKNLDEIKSQNIS